jgi:predicted methyltransferase
MTRACVLAVSLLSVSAVAGEPVGTTVGERFGWLAGCWSGQRGASTFREIWTEAGPDLMVGMGVTIRPGKPAEFEYLRIQSREGGVVYVAQPGGVPPTEFELSAAASSADTFVFVNPRHDFPKRVAYKRLDAAGLLAWIDGGEPGQDRMEFPLKRGGCPGEGAAAFAQDARPHSTEEMHRLHRDPKAYIAMLEDPARDAYQKPHEVINALALKPGEVIADIGSGAGYFTLRLAAHVGDSGRVYGVDIDPEMVRHLNRRIRDAGLRNVHALLADPDDPLLPEPVDRLLIVDTWHHIEAQARYLALMRTQLKAGGQVIMIDFQKRELPLGPPLAMKVAREDLIRQVEANGFHLVKEHTFLPYQYFLVFEARPPQP